MKRKSKGTIDIKFKMSINKSKTKKKKIRRIEDINIMLQSGRIEQVYDYKYLQRYILY